MTYLEKLGKYHPDIIDEFIRTGKSSLIPNDIQKIIWQLVWSMEIYHNDSNIVRCAKKLQTKTKAIQGVDIDISTAKSRIYAALSYFDVDCNVSEAIWLRDAANKFEDLKKYALAAGKIEAAGRFQEKAVDYRIRAAAADRQVSLGVVYVMSSELAPEDLGFTSKNKKEIARRAKDGYYLKLIDDLPISDKEKSRLKADAEIIDVEFEEEVSYE